MNLLFTYKMYRLNFEKLYKNNPNKIKKNKSKLHTLMMVKSENLLITTLRKIITNKTHYKFIINSSFNV